MVFINKQAKTDLDNIVIGLLEWEKVILTVPEVMQYMVIMHIFINAIEIQYGISFTIAIYK
jgi:hypothetical protein